MFKTASYVVGPAISSLQFVCEEEDLDYNGNEDVQHLHLVHRYRQVDEESPARRIGE